MKYEVALCGAHVEPAEHLYRRRAKAIGIKSFEERFGAASGISEHAESNFTWTKNAKHAGVISSSRELATCDMVSTIDSIVHIEWCETRQYPPLSLSRQLNSPDDVPRTGRLAPLADIHRRWNQIADACLGILFSLISRCCVVPPLPRRSQTI